jgi:hypothetical protein
MRASSLIPAVLALLPAACSWTGGQPGDAVVISERAAKYHGIGLGASTSSVRRVFGPGETDAGVSPVGKSPAEVGVPLVLPLPVGAWVTWPPRLRYEHAVFLIARDQVYAMMLTDPRLRTSRGVAIGDDIGEVRRRYRGVRCRRVAGGESVFGGQGFYPVCHVELRRNQVLFFGGDPIRSFTFHTRKLVGD